jgi:tetratricopeptide (TPR) repeat protein
VKLLRDSSLVSNQWIEAHVGALSQPAGATGAVKSKWCGACHDPALMFTGAMSGDLDRTSSEAQAGLTCLACHAIDKIHDRTGNGNYNIGDQREDPYIFARSESGSFGTFLHDAAIRAKPAAHKERMLRPFFKQSEFCATCHKVSLSPPINNYRWLRGQNEFDAWHDSGVSLNASRTFYLPPEKRECQDCHMPPEAAGLGDLAAKHGMVRSHRFLAVNTALPFIRGDDETVSRIEAMLQEGRLRVDVFALNSRGSGSTVMALDRTQPSLVAGDSVTIDVVVRNLGVGHTFPGGTTDSNEGWLEFTVSDERGNIVASNGLLGEDGVLDPMAHVYKSVLLDANGQPVLRRNNQDARVTVFANVIGPGSADLAHYALVVPHELAGTRIRISARLLWRKFNADFSKFAFEYNRDGFRAFDRVPELPVTEIASDVITLGVMPLPPAPSVVAETDEASWVRFNDYGIGLLMEGNSRAAAAAFAEVRSAAPDRVDGPLNLARAAIAEGDIELAYTHLRDSEARESGDARAAWVWGVVLQEDGRYQEAVLAYRRVLEQFPGDRAAWRNLGRTLYLDQQYRAALDAFDRVLSIDPEDRVSHYHRMLCYRAVGLDAEAVRAAEAYQYYAIDEAAQALTQSYRLRNPGVNLMTQRIRVHPLEVGTPR